MAATQKGPALLLTGSMCPLHFLKCHSCDHHRLNGERELKNASTEQLVKCMILLHNIVLKQANAHNRYEGITILESDKGESGLKSIE
jgi:hypothetical protein